MAMEAVRTFIAVEPDPPVRSWLSGWLDLLRSRWPEARWVAPEHLHLTVKFLGNVAAERLEEVKAIAAAVARTAAPFRLTLGAPGWFGPRRTPRTFWLGLVPGASLDRLGEVQGRLERALAERGFPADVRPFTAHLTLGRNPRQVPAEGWDGTLPPWAGPEPPGFPCRALSVFGSDLTPTGPIHRLLAEPPFGGAPGSRGGAGP